MQLEVLSRTARYLRYDRRHLAMQLLIVGRNQWQKPREVDRRKKAQLIR